MLKNTKIMENVSVIIILFQFFTIIYQMITYNSHNIIRKIKYYGVYDENDNLLKVIYLYKRELTFSEIMKIKQDYKMFRKQTVFVKEFNLIKNLREL